MRQSVSAGLMALLLAFPADAQRRILQPYEAPRVPAVSFRNSPRIDQQMRAGQLYLSLSDAIALALENNLDIELERFLPRIAGTDVERAKGGGLLRGLSLLVNASPPGIGGPSGPLLVNLTSGSTPTAPVNTNFSDLALISQAQNSLSVTGEIPAATGPAITSFDPAITAALNRTHQSAPQYITVLTGGTNWLVSGTTNGSLGFQQGFSPGTQLNVNFDNTRFSSNASRYTYDPAVNSSLGITIKQPCSGSR